jgi:hypothetical protein
VLSAAGSFPFQGSCALWAIILHGVGFLLELLLRGKKKETFGSTYFPLIFKVTFPPHSEFTCVGGNFLSKWEKGGCEFIE